MADEGPSDGHLPSDLREMVENLGSDSSVAVNHHANASSQLAWFGPTTSAAVASSSRSSPTQTGGRQPWLFPRRASSRGQQLSALSDWDNGQQSHQSPASIFTATPQTRSSIFASGQPTSSISANTAHASLSSPPTSADSANSLSNLGGHSSFTFRRAPPNPVPSLSVTSRGGPRLVAIEKETDDPSSAVGRTMSSPRADRGTPAAVSSLFAAPEPSSPAISRHGSYIRTASGTQYTRATAAETAPLPNHLYTKGLLSGRHSDITVIAFGTRYPLHRLLLDRAPYFSSALSEPWLESSAKEITLHPEEVDTNITQGAFELALKRIYGCYKDEEEDKEAIGLFATGCWLEMADLIEASLSSLMRQLCPANISTYIRLVTNNYYGKHGDRILAAAKAMLCRDGWEMPLRCFDGVPGEIIREIVGSDGLYVPNEWDRFLMAKRLLDRRLRDAAFETGLIDAHGNHNVPMPKSLMFSAIRFDSVYRQASSTNRQTVGSDVNDKWLAPYTSPDIAPILVLLDEGIHYIHMSFEQLQKIRSSRDALGLPLLPEKVVADALWLSMELRQRVVNAAEGELELGLTDFLEEDSTGENTPSEGASEQHMSATAKSKQAETRAEEEEGEVESDSWDRNAQPRKFWVPLADATYPLGGDLEPVAQENILSYKNRLYSRVSGTIEAQDAQWATDFASTLQDRPETPPDVASGPSPNVRYSRFPPFRFSVEFPATKNLKEKKRTYSSTVWYAGNLWNVYVQKTVGTRHTQLGVYLHREKHMEMSENILLPKLNNLSVDERIDQLEREMSLGLTRNMSRRLQGSSGSGNVFLTRDNDADQDIDDEEDELLHNFSTWPSQDLSTLSGLVRSSRNATKASEATGRSGGAHDGGAGRPGSADEDGNDAAVAGESNQWRISEAFSFEKKKKNSKKAIRRQPIAATLPPYIDPRPTTRTYFKIYSPSRSGRVLTVYESGPDKFNVSQSWGWKSSNLILDDALGLVEDEDGTTREPRLRFMIVIGNV